MKETTFDTSEASIPTTDMVDTTGDSIELSTTEVGFEATETIETTETPTNNSKSIKTI